MDNGVGKWNLHGGRSLVALVVCVCSLAVSEAVAGDWRQFRGENSNGRAEDGDVPVRWSESENLLWRAEMPGPGSSSPIVTGEHVFVTSYTGYGVDPTDPGEMSHLARQLVCLNRRDGSLRWKREVPARLPEDPFRGYISEHGYASSTPVTDGEMVYVFFGKTGAIAFDLAGNEKWRADLGQESSNRRWGSAASPILHKDFLIVNASDESQSVRAFDKRSGKEVWRAEAASLELAYGTAQIASRPTGGEDLVLAVPGEVWGLNAETGKLRWYAETGLSGNICPSLTLSSGIAYGFGGYPTQGSFAVRLSGEGDVTASHVLWKSRVSSYVASPVLHEGHLFWVSDRGDAMCANASDGSLVFSERLPGLSDAGRKRPAYASLVYAAERFYAVTRFSGTYVFKAQPSFELLATNQLSDATQFNGTPAISGDQIYLRSDKFVYALGSH